MILTPLNHDTYVLTTLSLMPRKKPSEWANLGRRWQEDFGLLLSLTQENVGDVGVRLILLHEINHMIVRVTTSRHTLLPLLILTTIGINDQLSAFQWQQLALLQIAATTRGKP